MLIIAAFVIGLGTEPIDAPGVELGTPTENARLEHATVVQHVAPDHVRITLSFTLATDAARGMDIAVPIDIPRDAAITGMRLSLGEQTSVGRLEWSDTARETYDAIVTRERDPALLEWRAASDANQELVLRVFPVSTKTPARVSIDIVANRVLAIPQAEHRIVKSQLVRPMLGFGHQLGQRMSLLATDRPARPNIGQRAAKLGATGFSSNAR